MIFKIDQWLCLLNLHGIVPSQKAEHHAVTVVKGKRKIGVDSGKFSESFLNNNKIEGKITECRLVNEEGIFS